MLEIVTILQGIFSIRDEGGTEPQRHAALHFFQIVDSFVYI